MPFKQSIGYNPYFSNEIMSNVTQQILQSRQLNEVNIPETKSLQEARTIESAYKQKLMSQLDQQMVAKATEERLSKYNNMLNTFSMVRKLGIPIESTWDAMKDIYGEQMEGMEPQNLKTDELGKIHIYDDPKQGVKFAMIQTPDGKWKTSDISGDKNVPGMGDLNKFEAITGTSKDIRGTPEYEEAYITHEKKLKEAQGDVMGQYQKAQVAHNIRNEMKQDPYIKNFQDVDNKYEVMKKALELSKSADNFVAVDQALISLFNRMSEPDSVTMVSEYARTSQDISFINRMKGKIEKIKKGGAGLTQDERSALLEMASKFHEVYKGHYDDKVNNYMLTAEQSGIDPNWVGIPYRKKEEAQTPSQSPQTAEEYLRKFNQ